MDKKDMIMATLKANGDSNRTIGKKLGVHHSTVTRRMQQYDVQEYLQYVTEQIRTKIIENAVDNIDTLVRDYKLTQDRQMKEHGFKASMELVKGIIPAAFAPKRTETIEFSSSMKTLIDAMEARDGPTKSLLDYDDNDAV
jgi:hypothetical protein